MSVFRERRFHHAILVRAQKFSSSASEREPHMRTFLPPPSSPIELPPDSRSIWSDECFRLLAQLFRRSDRGLEEEKKSLFRFSVRFPRSPLGARRGAARRFIPISCLRAGAQNKVYVRKILCRIRRFLARVHNRWRYLESGKFIRPKSLARLRRALRLAPELLPLTNKLRHDPSWHPYSCVCPA